jgi:hypothetical protein
MTERADAIFRVPWIALELTFGKPGPDNHHLPRKALRPILCDKRSGPCHFPALRIEAALRAVVRNKGAPGVDGITVRQLPGILKARWPEIEDQLLQGRYQPQPVRRVKIPKPAGGTRNLGIPTVAA